MPTPEKRYRVNEIFYSVQGEGVRAGTANVFVRFSGCNLACALATEGFDCDTEFTSGSWMTGEEMIAEISRSPSAAVIWTGGEPGLQLDAALVAMARKAGLYQAIESNGTGELPAGLDWVTVSPKTAEHTLRPGVPVQELKYVRRAGMAIPKPSLAADHLLLSPACNADGSLDRESLAWCIELVKANPAWRLSCQQHKQWRVR